MKKTYNSNKPVLQSPINKKARFEKPKEFITPPRSKPGNILDQQPWSVGGKTVSSRSENSVHITRNRDFTFPDNHDEVMSANFVAKYNILKELSDEIEALRSKLNDLNIANKKNKEKNTNNGASVERHRMADTRSKVTNISRMLENIFIQMLPKIESGGSIDATLKKIISDLNEPDSTGIITTLVAAINKSYENAGNDPEKKLASFSNRLQIIKLLSDSEFKHGTDNPWSKIHEYCAILLQLNFERELEKLGMYFTPLSKLQNGSTKRTRIIFTDLYTSIEGFKYMHTWHEANPGYFEDIKDTLKNAGAVKVNTNPLRPVLLDLEIAWYHLMNDGRHTEENVIFVGQLQSLEYAIKFCTRDSTLVLNAHGGQNELTINKISDSGSKNSVLKGPALVDHIKTIVGIINSKITHVILAICATGYLYSDKNIIALDKHTVEDDNTADLKRQKNRKKIFIDETSIHNKLENILGAFGKLPIGSDSVALTFAKFLFSRIAQDQYLGTAFTFSPTIIHPGIAPYGGLIAAPKGLDINRRDWPEYNTDWNVDGTGLKLQEVAYKSYTLYNNTNNRKAYGRYGTWKSLPSALNLKWKQESNDDPGAFSSFGWIIFELIKKKILNNDNKFVYYYNSKLVSPHVMFNNSGSSAIIHAFTQSIMNDSSNFDTPFDYDFIMLCEIVLGRSTNGTDNYVINLMHDELEDLLHKVCAINAEKVSTGIELYNYIKHNQPTIITTAKEIYCRSIIDNKNKFKARLFDMLYIARKLGCFSEVHERRDITNPAITQGKQYARVHVLSDNPSGLTLYTCHSHDKGWQASIFDIDKQNNIAAQQCVPEYAIMSWPYTSFIHHKSGTGFSIKTESSPETLQWNESIGIENLCGFASFDAPLQELRDNGLLNINNKFFDFYLQSIDINQHLCPKLRNAQAIKAAFASSIMEDTSDSDTPFDYDMHILCGKLLLKEINAMEDTDDYYEGLIDGRFKSTLKSVFEEYEISQIDASVSSAVPETISSSNFYRYLKQNNSELISTIRTSYCRNIIDSNREFQARAHDMLYIARKLECIATVHIYYDSEDESTVELYQLDKPNGLDLHIRSKNNHWEAASLKSTNNYSNTSAATCAYTI